MQIDEKRRQLVSELNEFVKTLDENVREAIGRLPPKEAWQLAAELREHLDAL